MLQILYDSWFVSIVSIFIGLAIEPIVRGAINYVRSRFGAFTGVYLALTGQPDETILVECVHAKHVGRRFYGRITGLAFVRLDRVGRKNMSYKAAVVAKSTARYRFDGSISERVFVVSYHTTITAVRNSGAITLNANDLGSTLTGMWGGFDNGIVKSASCIWHKISAIDTSKLEDQSYLESLVSKFAEGDYGSFGSVIGGVGKSRLLDYQGFKVPRLIPGFIPDDDDNDDK